MKKPIFILVLTLFVLGLTAPAATMGKTKAGSTCRGAACAAAGQGTRDECPKENKACHLQNKNKNWQDKLAVKREEIIQKMVDKLLALIERWGFNPANFGFCPLGPAPVCGNGILEEGEQCDDNNTTPGDGCDAGCQLEPEEVTVRLYPTADGILIRRPDVETWTELINGEGAEVHAVPVENITLNYPIEVVPVVDEAYRYNSNRRSVFMFDTSVLPEEAAIMAAKFAFMTNSGGRNILDAGNVVLNVVATASSSCLNVSDYNNPNWGEVSLTDDIIGPPNMAAEEYNIWNFNATGLAAIDPEGMTNIGMRFEKDMTGEQIGWLGGNIYNRSIIAGYFSGWEGTSSDPYLEVTYKQ